MRLIEIENAEHQGVHTLSLSGELDMAAVPSLEAEIRHLCAQGTRGITLDLGGLRFIDSTGLAAIVLVGRLCDKRGLSFELLPGPRAVQRLFEMTGLADELPFRPAEPPTPAPSPPPPMPDPTPTPTPPGPDPTPPSPGPDPAPLPPDPNPATI